MIDFVIGWLGGTVVAVFLMTIKDELNPKGGEK